MVALPALEPVLALWMVTVPELPPTAVEERALSLWSESREVGALANWSQVCSDVRNGIVQKFLDAVVPVLDL